MSWEAWTIIGLLILVIIVLVRNLAGPDTVLLGVLTVLMTLALIPGANLPTPAQIISGFGNEGLVTIAVLFVVTAGLERTGAMLLLTEPMLGRPRSVLGAQVRLMFPVAVLSAFLNNTPIVAMFMPVVSDWCKKTGLSPSKLFIPLSYAAILGGSCTLIGTATNLVVFSSIDPSLQQHIGMFTISKLAVPVAVMGITFVILISPVLLPDRRRGDPGRRESRQYTVEMVVKSDSAIDGKSIEAAGLRNLPGLYLIEIERDGERLVAVGPDQVLHGQDRLIFAGLVDSVVDLQRIRGLMPATNQVFKLSDPHPNRRLVEAVVSDTCPLVGKSIREGRFRSVYDAAVIAVHRNGEHLNQKIGDIVLRAGDTLLMDTHPRFVNVHRDSVHFFLVSAVVGSEPIRHDRAWLALFFFLLMVGLATFTSMKLVNAALLTCAAMVLTKCCSPQEARNSIRWRILLVIGSAIGIGQAMTLTGAATHIGSAIVNVLAQYGPHVVLAGICILAMIMASVIQPVATALLLLPIGMVAAQQLGVSSMPFVMSLMMIPAASFATPMAYQTNLMVFGAGGYRFSDYLRIGLPLNLLVIVMTVWMAPRIWPFH